MFFSTENHAFLLVEKIHPPIPKPPGARRIEKRGAVLGSLARAAQWREALCILEGATETGQWSPTDQSHRIGIGFFLTFMNWNNYLDMGVSLNGGTHKSSILIGFSIVNFIHFGIPLFLETSISLYIREI